MEDIAVDLAKFSQSDKLLNTKVFIVFYSICVTYIHIKGSC